MFIYHCFILLTIIILTKQIELSLSLDLLSSSLTPISYIRSGDNNLENLDRTDIKTLILTNTEEQTKTISSTQCVLSYTEESGFKYSCTFALSSTDEAAKYFITFVNKCGIESEKSADIVVTFINAPNVVTSVSPKSMKLPIKVGRNLRSLQTNEFSLYFFNPLNNQNRPYSLTLINKNNVTSDGVVILDDSSISGNMI